MPTNYRKKKVPKWKKQYLKSNLKKELSRKNPNPLIISLYKGDMDYEDYLLSDHWKVIKKRKIKQANYQCEVCGEDEIMLQVHHKHYDNLGCEKDEDLAVLCPHCHQDVHKIISELKGKEFRQRLTRIAIQYFTKNQGDINEKEK